MTSKECVGGSLLDKNKVKFLKIASKRSIFGKIGQFPTAYCLKRIYL